MLYKIKKLEKNIFFFFRSFQFHFSPKLLPSMAATLCLKDINLHISILVLLRLLKMIFWVLLLLMLKKTHNVVHYFYSERMKYSKNLQTKGELYFAYCLYQCYYCCC